MSGYPDEGFFRNPTELAERTRFTRQPSSAEEAEKDRTQCNQPTRKHVRRSASDYPRVGGAMKITIVVGGRWHAFNLARKLYAKGHLHRLITNYPSWIVSRWGILIERVVSLPRHFG